MGQLKIKIRSNNNGPHRIIYLVFHNISATKIPKSSYSIRVKEGSKVVHQSDHGIFGPLEPGENEDRLVGGILKAGLFGRQEIVLTANGEEFQFSVGAFS